MSEQETGVIGDWVRRLEVVLQSEEDLYLRFKAVLRREEAELIGLDPQEIAETVSEKRALAEEARLHEESRLHVTQTLAGLLGFEGGTPRLSELIATLGEESGELSSLHGRLSALIGATQSLLASNERFANRSLSRVQETLRLLGQAVPEDNGYGPGGQRTSASGRGRLVRASI